MHPQLIEASSLKPEIVEGLDIMIVRELTGGIYFGKPRGVRIMNDGEREGFNTLVYRESEIRRIGHSAFQIAIKRNRRVCSVDKANVLECTELWRDIMDEISSEYPDVELSHMYVDNAAMQLVRAPKQFDVMVTTNMFGDILSDCASMLTGSIGMLPSASLDVNGKGMYEPIHGSAPDIAGLGRANPLATILSVSMLLRYTFAESDAADLVDQSVQVALESGIRTPDIYSAGLQEVSTSGMGDAVVAAMHEVAQSPLTGPLARTSFSACGSGQNLNLNSKNLMSKTVNVAVVGVTGAVGETMLSILQQRNFPVAEVYPLASSRSVGKKVEFGGRYLTVQDLAEFDFSNVQIGLFSAGAGISRKYGPRAVAAGCVVVDNTSEFRYDDDIPLVVPEVESRGCRWLHYAWNHCQSELLHDSDGSGPESDPPSGGDREDQCGDLPGGIGFGQVGGG